MKLFYFIRNYTVARQRLAQLCIQISKSAYSTTYTTRIWTRFWQTIRYCCHIQLVEIFYITQRIHSETIQALSVIKPKEVYLAELWAFPASKMVETSIITVSYGSDHIHFPHQGDNLSDYINSYSEALSLHIMMSQVDTLTKHHTTMHVLVSFNMM